MDQREIADGSPCWRVPQHQTASRVVENRCQACWRGTGNHVKNLCLTPFPHASKPGRHLRKNALPRTLPVFQPASRIFCQRPAAPLRRPRRAGDAHRSHDKLSPTGSWRAVEEWLIVSDGSSCGSLRQRCPNCTVQCNYRFLSLPLPVDPGRKRITSSAYVAIFPTGLAIFPADLAHAFIPQPIQAKSASTKAPIVLIVLFIKLRKVSERSRATTGAERTRPPATAPKASDPMLWVARCSMESA